MVTATVTLDRAVDSDTTFTLALDNTAVDTDVDANVDGAGDDDDATFANGVNTVTIAANNTTGTAMIAIIDDTIAESAETFTVRVTAVLPEGVTLPTEVATVTITDDDSAGITVGSISGATSESGETATFTVRLNTQPTANVVVTPTSSDTGEGTVSGALTFSTSNWNTAQTITVTGVDDSLDDGNQIYQISFAVASTDSNYNEFTLTPVVEVTNSDDDSAGITVGSISGATSEAGGMATFTVRLNTQPSADVVVTPTSSDTDEGTVSGALTFTAANWNTAQTITVTGVDDTAADGNQTYQISFAVTSTDSDYNEFTLTPVEVTNSDDDSAGITVVATDATTDESGGTATITVRLNTQPSANVVVTPTSSDPDEGTVSGALTFSTSNWGTEQTITVTGVDDSLVDGNQTYQISFAVASTDSDYNEFTLTPVEVTNSDDDYSATIVATTQAAEPSTDGVFTISLDRNAPTAGITVNYDITGSATAGDDYATLPGNATIAAGSSTGTVVVDVTDDALDDDAETVVLTLTGGSAGTGTVIVGPSATATVTITDDDTADITVGSISGATSEAGGMATFTVRLTTQPTADVTVTPTSNDVGEGTVSGALTFTATNWGTAQTITVTGVNDSLVDGNQTYQISFAVASADGDYNEFTLTPVDVTNSDDDSAGITVVATDATTDESSETATITVRLNTQPSANVVVTPTSSDPDEGTVSGALTFSTSNWGTEQTITVTGVDDSLVDGNQTYQISFAVASTDSDYSGFMLTSVDVINSDDDYSATIMATTTQAAEPSTDGVFTISLDRNAPTDGVTVNYDITGSATAGDDYATLPGSATIAAGSSTGTVVVDVTDDALDDDAETVVLTLTGGSAGSGTVIVGGPSATATVTITDDDTADITVSGISGATSEAGGMATFTVRLTTQPTADVTVTPTSSDVGEGTVSGALTFSTSNWNTAQTITVTGVNDSLVDGNQPYQISFAVTSTDSDYNEFTLTPVDVTNSDDDYSATIVATTQAAEPSTDGVFTISLDRNAPTAGVTVDYDITGSATAGDDYATLPGSATIAAGNDTGTVVVDVTDDALDDDAETVVLTLTGGSAGSGTVIVGPSATASITITDDVKDYDTDNDGLIEVRSLAQLDAIRYDLDGNGRPSSGDETAYAIAYPEPIADMGCPSGCTGYELMANLNFDTDGDGSTHTDGAGDAGDAYYNGGSGWEPIGTLSNSYTATFEGNSNTIDNLFINRSSANEIGLFGSIIFGEIKNIGVVDVYVTGKNRVGGLVGFSNSGTISASYATGAVTGSSNVGGLVGNNVGGTISASYATGTVTGVEDRVGGLVGEIISGSTISASYATGTVIGEDRVGGLVGISSSSSTISASYATGAVTGVDSRVGGLVGVSSSSSTISASYATGAVTGNRQVGGLVGDNAGTISASYSDSTTTEQSNPVGSGSASDASAQTTAQLQMPTSYTGIYASWNVDIDNADGGDMPWDFGTTSQYPALAVDFDGDGTASVGEFGSQR